MIFSTMVCCRLSQCGIGTSFCQSPESHVSFYLLSNSQNLFCLIKPQTNLGRTGEEFYRRKEKSEPQKNVSEEIQVLLKLPQKNPDADVNPSSHSVFCK